MVLRFNPSLPADGSVGAVADLSSGLAADGQCKPEGTEGWTDVGQQLGSESLPSFKRLDKLPGTELFSSGIFGDDAGLTPFDREPFEESASAEPSLARTSELGFHDLHVAPPEHEDTECNTVFDPSTALEVAARSIPAHPVEQVWEQGIWGVIFENKSLLDVYKPFGESLKRPFDTSTAQSSTDISMPQSSRLRTLQNSGLSFHDVVKNKPDIPWQEQRDADLQSSVKLWMALVNRWDSGCSLVASTLELEDTGRIFTMFAHLFAGRSPITVKKRCYSIMRICDYLEKVGSFFPCSERSFYDFLCSEQTAKAPQSRLKGYMQSVNFVRHVMSVHELEPLTKSARCKGACLADFIQERVQASPLRVVELQKLHDLLYSCEDVWVRLFSGALLMATYCRARWGDLMRSESVIMDFDSEGKLQYLEARTGRHKTMKSQLHRHQFLPMVSPCHGIDGKDWGSIWIEVRKQLDVRWPPEGLVMPAPGMQGEVTSRPLETQECAAWLRKIVGHQDSDEKRRIASHSLKSTFLSYAAKRGIGIPERLQLGYHTSNFQMGMVYSRDGAAASIMVLEKLIDEIRDGSFDPDNTRSGRVKPQTQILDPAGTKDVVHVKDEPEVVEISDESSSQSDSSSTSSEEERPRVIKNQPVIQPKSAPDGFVMWQHKKLKTLHLMSVENRRVFSCGRMAGPLHEELSEAPQFDTPICGLCFSKARQ